MPRKTLKDTRYALSDEEVKKALEVEREYKEKKKADESPKNCELYLVYIKNFGN